MADTIKPNMHRVYLDEEHSQLLAMAVAKSELGQSDLLSKLVKASLRALAANEYRMTLPIRLKVSHVEDLDTAYVLHEKKSRKSS